MTASRLPEGRASGARLRDLERLATKVEAEEVARQVADLSSRVAEGRYYVACVGQFKRGKSTLLNALVDRSVLPTGVVPVTSVITVLRHGAEAGARVWLEGGGDRQIDVGRIGDYVSESQNPGNRRGVHAVEVFLPSPLLAQGMCLVDTPGLGSVFGANAATTRAFVPHMDAALVVIGSDPPLSGEELRLIEEVAPQVRHLLFVLNKADRFRPEDRDEVARFTEQVLSASLGRSVGQVYQVSATERLSGRGPARDWPALEIEVAALAHEARSELVCSAEERGFQRLATALGRELDERRMALVRPLEESERRLAALQGSVAAAHRALGDLGVLLAAEQARLVQDFRDRQASFYPRALGPAIRDLGGLVAGLSGSKTKLRRLGFELARGVARTAVEGFRREIEPVAEEMYRRSTERFVALTNDFLERLANSGEPGLEGLPRALGPELGFRAPSELYYANLMYRTTDLFGWILDALRPRPWAVRAVVHRAGRYLESLLESNSSRIANDLGERVARSRERLERELRSALQRVSEAAERALQRSRARHAEGGTAVREELDSLEKVREELESLSSTRSEERAHERHRVREST